MSQIFQDIRNSWSSQTEQDQSVEARPFGVTIVAIAVIFAGGWYTLEVLLGLCVINVGSSLESTMEGASAPGTITPSLSLFSPLFIAVAPLIFVIIYTTILAFLHFYLARGIWKVQLWAYWATVAVEVVSILIAFIVLLTNHNGGLFFASAYIPILIAAYLLIVSGVRRSFNVPF